VPPPRRKLHGQRPCPCAAQQTPVCTQQRCLLYLIAWKAAAGESSRSSRPHFKQPCACSPARVPGACRLECWALLGALEGPGASAGLPHVRASLPLRLLNPPHSARSKQGEENLRGSSVQALEAFMDAASGGGGGGGLPAAPAADSGAASADGAGSKKRRRSGPRSRSSPYVRRDQR